jgi:GntR family transcriptional regulator
MGSAPHSNSWEDVLDDLSRIIMHGGREEGDELPSVRRLAKERHAHHETIRKAYDALADAGVIEKRAGLPPIVAKGARERLKEAERKRLMSEELPSLIAAMERLEIGWDELRDMAAMIPRSHQGPACP